MREKRKKGMKKRGWKIRNIETEKKLNTKP